MRKNAVHPALLQLLVSAYNQSIQTYFYFPDVILCGRHRLEREAFDELVALDFVQTYGADSFGRYYRLSPKGEAFLFQASFRRRQKHPATMPLTQASLPFADIT